MPEDPGFLLALIHLIAWKVNSPNFVGTEFFEVLYLRCSSQGKMAPMVEDHLQRQQAMKLREAYREKVARNEVRGSPL